MSQPLHQSQVRNLALIALGSNATSSAGGPQATLFAAISALGEIEGRVVKSSQLFETPCFPAGAGPDFVNAAVCFETVLCAKELLANLHSIERSFGRKRLTRWGQRTLDLDLLGFGDEVIPNRAEFLRWHDLPGDSQAKEAPDQLILPHPRMQDRGFVLVPLAEVAPDWIHPVLGQSVAQMLAALDPAEIRDVRPLG